MYRVNLYKIDKYNEALIELDDISLKKSKYQTSYVHQMRGEILYSFKKYDEALANLNEACKNMGNDGYNNASVYYHRGQSRTVP